MSSLYILDTRLLVNTLLANIFSHSVALFTFMTVSLDAQNIHSDAVQFVYFFL